MLAAMRTVQQSSRTKQNSTLRLKMTGKQRFRNFPLVLKSLSSLQLLLEQELKNLAAVGIVLRDSG